MSWLLFLFFAQGENSKTLAWDSTSMTLIDIHGMESPTALLRVGDRWIAGADLDEAFTGVYSLVLKNQVYQAQLLKYLPQLDIEELAYTPQTGWLRVISARRFSAQPSDWVGQFLELEPRQLKLTDVAMVGISCLCFDESMRCGLTAAFPLNENTWVAVKKRDPATVYLLERRGKAWFQKVSATLTYQRRFITVTAVRRVDSQLLFLVKDRWLLGGLPLTKLSGEVGGELGLTTVFDFRQIEKKLPLAQRTNAMTGMAESFDIDERGVLHIILNNRGIRFLGLAGATPTVKPKVAVFQPLRVPLPLGEQ